MVIVRHSCMSAFCSFFEILFCFFVCEAAKDSIWLWFYCDLPADPDIKPGDLLIDGIRGGELIKCIIKGSDSTKDGGGT